jgi:hypothetical protein
VGAMGAEAVSAALVAVAATSADDEDGGDCRGLDGERCGVVRGEGGDGDEEDSNDADMGDENGLAEAADVEWGERLERGATEGDDEMADVARCEESPVLSLSCRDTDEERGDGGERTVSRYVLCKNGANALPLRPELRSTSLLCSTLSGSGERTDSETRSAEADALSRVRRSPVQSEALSLAGLSRGAVVCVRNDDDALGVRDVVAVALDGGARAGAAGDDAELESDDDVSTAEEDNEDEGLEDEDVEDGARVGREAEDADDGVETDGSRDGPVLACGRCIERMASCSCFCPLTSSWKTAIGTSTKLPAVAGAVSVPGGDIATAFPMGSSRAGVALCCSDECDDGCGDIPTALSLFAPR